MGAWFYDTWGFLALANRRDEDHDAAAQADRWRQDHGVVVVTSDYVIDETLTALHAAAGATVALRFLDLLEARTAARRVLLVEITTVRREAALARFRRLASDVPRLSFTDCTSFAVMEELGIEIAFTADRRFRRAGGAIRPLFEVDGGPASWSPPA